MYKVYAKFRFHNTIVPCIIDFLNDKKKFVRRLKNDTGGGRRVVLVQCELLLGKRLL